MPTIGDTVSFTLTATVPTTAADYNYYFFILNDTLDAGLTLQPTSIAVTSNKADKATLAADTDYQLYLKNDATHSTDDDHTFEIALLDAKSFAGKTITVTYDAVLNENCTMFEVPNKNTFKITYSNNPKYDYDGDKDNNKPGKPASNKDTPTGETPDKETETYTTDIKIRKVDQDGNALKGAKFTISGDSVEKIVHYTDTFTQDANGAYWKLTNNTYTDQAPQTADQMIAAPSGATDGYVVAEAGFEGETITVGGTAYRVVNENETPTHILKKNSEMYASTEIKYKKTRQKSVEDSTSHVSAELTVQEDGTLFFDGLGAGDYTITETEASSGYTKANPFHVVITFNNPADEDDGHWSATGATKDAEGYFVVDVVNVAGNTLPSTGGIGTTIFYVGGSVLVLAAAILLITKRRMSNND